MIGLGNDLEIWSNKLYEEVMLRDPLEYFLLAKQWLDV